MQRATCDCGNTLFFGEEEETRLCDRCGQEVRASGAAAAEPKPRPAAERRAAAKAKAQLLAGEPSAADVAPEPLAAPARRLGFLRRAFRLAFRAPVLIVVLLGVAGADYYLRPPRKLPCGHVRKELYGFGRLRIRHMCPAMKGLYYLNRAREGINRERDGGGDVTPSLLAVMALPGVGQPTADVKYKLIVRKDLSLAADPPEADSDLPSLFLELDGTVRVEFGRDAGPGSPIVGVFDGDGAISAAPGAERAGRGAASERGE